MRDVEKGTHEKSPLVAEAKNAPRKTAQERLGGSVAAQVRGWLIPLIVIGGVNILYMYFAVLNDRRYLKWAANETRNPIPDIILDYAPLFRHSPFWIVVVADTLPMLMPLGFFMAIMMRDEEAWCVTALIQGSFMVSRTIAQTVTVMPSSYGVDGCLDYYEMEEGDRLHMAETMMSTGLGTCSAMIWSGHTSHTMLGVWMLCTLWHRNYGTEWLLEKPTILSFFCLDASWRTIFSLIGAFLVGPMILLTRGHYTVDVFLAILVTLLVLTSDKVMDLCRRGHIWIRGEDPKEGHVPMQ